MESIIKHANYQEKAASCKDDNPTEEPNNKKIKLEKESSICSTQCIKSKINKLGNKYILRHKIQLKSQETATDVQSKTTESVTNVNDKNKMNIMNSEQKTNKNCTVLHTTASECPSQDNNELYKNELVPTKALNFSSSIYNRRVKVKIVNLLLNTNESVPVKEETKFKCVYHYVNGPLKFHALEIVFRDYVHVRILNGNSRYQEEVFCRCTKYDDWGCTGSVTLHNEKVVRFRDHFCKGRADKRFTDLDLTDFSILVFYFNTEQGCQEILYNGFMYWKVAQDEDDPNDFEWVCTANPKCKAILKILQQQSVAVVGRHVCLLTLNKKSGSPSLCGSTAQTKKDAKKVLNNNNKKFKKQYVMIKKGVEC